jgi:hypothetical protein
MTRMRCDDCRGLRALPQPFYALSVRVLYCDSLASSQKALFKFALVLAQKFIHSRRMILTSFGFTTDMGIFLL